MPPVLLHIQNVVEQIDAARRKGKQDESSDCQREHPQIEQFSGKHQRGENKQILGDWLRRMAFTIAKGSPLWE